MPPIPITLSPSLNRVTLDPILETSPANSWPKTVFGGAMSYRYTWTSVPQIALCEILIWISSGPGSGVGISSTSKLCLL